MVAFGINTCITLYLAVWLPYVAKIHLEWAVYCPRMIPTATVIGLICALWYVAPRSPPHLCAPVLLRVFTGHRHCPSVLPPFAL